MPPLYARTEKDTIAKRSIITIRESDNLSFPRSLIVALAYCERGALRVGELHDKWLALRGKHSLLQRKRALELMRCVGVAIPAEGCGIQEIQSFEAYLSCHDIAIVVFNFKELGRGFPPRYDGREAHRRLSSRVPRFILYIMYYEQRRYYEPIIKLLAAVSSKKYCVMCNTGYSKQHYCSMPPLPIFEIKTEAESDADEVMISTKPGDGVPAASAVAIIEMKTDAESDADEVMISTKPGDGVPAASAVPIIEMKTEAESDADEVMIATKPGDGVPAASAVPIIAVESAVQGRSAENDDVRPAVIITREATAAATAAKHRIILEGAECSNSGGSPRINIRFMEDDAIHIVWQLREKK